MKKHTHNDYLSILMGNLWLAKPEVIEELQQKYQISNVKTGSFKAANPAKEQPPVVTDNKNNAPSFKPNDNLHAPLGPVDSSMPPTPVKASEAELNTTTNYSMMASSTKTGISAQNLFASQLIASWEELEQKVFACHDCKLCHQRKNVVLERGSRSARVMLIGEGPGEQEDIKGKPFVGASGLLLDKMITAMKLNPLDEVYIANVVKCRPPQNRNPQPDEIATCRHYLLSQIALVKPQIIITLGRFAAQTILNTDLAVGKLRGKTNYYEQIPVIATYHPSYLLRNPDAKKDAWADLQLAIAVHKNSLGV